VLIVPFIKKVNITADKSTVVNHSQKFKMYGVHVESENENQKYRCWQDMLSLSKSSIYNQNIVYINLKLISGSYLIMLDNNFSSGLFLNTIKIN